MVDEGKETSQPEAANIDVTVQRATDRDIADYISITKKVESKTYAAVTTEQGARAEMERGAVFMIRQGKETVGIISYDLESDGSVYISELAVDPKYQGRGFARKAMEQILVKVVGAPKIWLMTHPDNVGAIHLYEAIGFEKTGEVKENYFGDGEPRIELVLNKK